jgi:multidrug efflux pump subunit AcrA (membrane-fusion protein)
MSTSSVADAMPGSTVDGRSGAAAAGEQAKPLSTPAEAWEAFAASQAPGDMLAAWLALQCSEVRSARAAALLLARPDGSYGPAAVWPERFTDVTHLAAVAERALGERVGVAVPAAADRGADDAGLLVAYPIEGLGEIHGAVVMDVAARAGPQLQEVFRRIHWGIGWIEAFIARNRVAESGHKLDAASLALEMLAVVNEHETLDGAAIGLVNELAKRLNCERVAFGLVEGGDVHLRALSNTAWFQEQADIVAALENAMEEAFDQSGSVVLPPLPATASRITIAHAELMTAWKATSVASVIMRPRGEIIGVLAFERLNGEPFDAASLEAAELVAQLAGPVLELKAETRKLFAGRIAGIARKTVRALFGRGHPAAKLAVLAATATIATLALWHSEFRVTAKSVLEGAVQRAAVAPFQGFIQEAPAKAGDIVRAGQLLAALDDRDLHSDVMKWESERQKNLQRERDALAKHDRTGGLVAAAQRREAEAELALATEKLSRTRIVAPIDGIVVSGDLSQLIGTPVEQGKVLFEIAPLNAYRVVVQVSEFDIRHVWLGQEGQISLTGSAGATVPFRVERITPITTQQNGHNVFRVEGLLGESDVELRPGMEGIAKLSAGDASLLWIWTRGLIERARIAAWEWTP